MPDNPHYVLDTSVIAKWFLSEEDSEKAVEIRDLFVQGRIRISTISLARYELGNVLWKHPSKTEKNVREEFEALAEMSIPTEDLDDPDILARTFKTARDLKVTFYDASYVMLAEKSKAIFVTADERLHEKLGRIDATLLREWRKPVRLKRHLGS